MLFAQREHRALSSWQQSTAGSVHTSAGALQRRASTLASAGEDSGACFSSSLLSPPCRALCLFPIHHFTPISLLPYLFYVAKETAGTGLSPKKLEP